MIRRNCARTITLSFLVIAAGCHTKRPSMSVKARSQDETVSPSRSYGEVATDHSYKTAMALHEAARAGDIQTTRTLLDQGADVNTMAYGGYPPLHAAAAAGHLEVVKLLLDRGAEINKRSGKNRTPVWEASFKDRDEVVSFLKSRGGVK